MASIIQSTTSRKKVTPTYLQLCSFLQEIFARHARHLHASHNNSADWKSEHSHKMRGSERSSTKSKAQRRVWTTLLLACVVGTIIFSFDSNNNNNDDDDDRGIIKEGERIIWEHTKQMGYSDAIYGEDSISSTQSQYGSESVFEHTSKKFLNSFNGAVAMHKGSCKEGAQIQTPWIGKDGKKITLGSCTKKALAVLPDTDPIAFRRYNSCAVVGSGGIMVHKSVAADNLGEAIDKQDAVFRFNLAPTKGFEKSVGSKTTFRLINRKHFGFREFENETTLQHTTTPDVMKQFLDYRSLHPDLPTYPIDGSFYKYVMSDKDVANTRPSNGYLGLNLALMICDMINVYGFARNWKQRNMKYHYFNREEPNESQMLRDGKGEMPLIEHLMKKNKNRIKMVHM